MIESAVQHGLPSSKEALTSVQPLNHQFYKILPLLEVAYGQVEELKRIIFNMWFATLHSQLVVCVPNMYSVVV